MKKLLAALLLCVCSSLAQTSLTPGVIKSVSSLPGTCTAGTMVYLSTAQASQVLYVCGAGNVWYQQSGVRTCVIDNDTQSATALVAANFSGGCVIPAAATLIEVDVWGGTGVIGGTVTTTGTGSINVQRYRPNGGSTATILSGNLATASGQACAMAATSGTCINGTTSSGTITISATTVNAGDWIRVSAATPDTAQTWYRVAVLYTF